MAWLSNVENQTDDFKMQGIVPHVKRLNCPLTCSTRILFKKSMLVWNISL